MSVVQKEPNWECLLSRQDAKLNNIKFFRGTDKLIEASDFREEFCDSLARRRAASVPSEFPKCRKAPVDVRDFVKNM
jgi:hypothetical protein